MFEPKKLRLRAPVLRLQILASVVLSAVAIVAMWVSAHDTASRSRPHDHAAGPFHHPAVKLHPGRDAVQPGLHHL
jgi:hypothetical protein